MFGLIVTHLACAGSDTFELLSKTENAFPEHSRYLGAIAERRSSSMAKKIESFDLLQKNFKKTWKEDLNSIETVAPSDNTKAIFFKAAQILSREDYRNFLMATCPLVESGKISKQQLKWGLFPAEKHLREMWIENPPSSSLKDLACQASLIFADDEGMKVFLDRVFSGQLGIDSVGRDEKSLSATPLAYQKRPTEAQRPERRPLESPVVGTPLPNKKNLDSSVARSFVHKIGGVKILTFTGIIGVIIMIALIWRSKSKFIS